MKIEVHEHIITIGDRLETYPRSIGDRFVRSETHQRPTCLVGDPLETNMHDLRRTCLIGDQHG